MPANGPDAPTGAQSKSLFPYFGAGMLKEAGIVDVKVDVASNTVFFSDHFAGLVAIGPADNPLLVPVQIQRRERVWVPPGTAQVGLTQVGLLITIP